MQEDPTNGFGGLEERCRRTTKGKAGEGDFSSIVTWLNALL